jgi:hypothetical protein
MTHEELLSLIEKLEWSGYCSGCDCCPSCFAHDNDDIRCGRRVGGFHVDGCEVALALGRSTKPLRPPQS